MAIPLRPGLQKVELEWTQESGSRMVMRTPAIDVGSAAVNNTITCHVPHGRWLLWTSGPVLGPAVLFWGYFLVVVIMAFFLGKIPMSPLKTWQWVLLGLGLTQVSPAVALVVAGWFLALASRGLYKVPDDDWRYYDAQQIVTVIWTFAAISGLFMAIKTGLLGIPDMMITGGESTDMVLKWTQDRISGKLPQPFVISVPIGVYRALMLAWALWLAISLLSWLKWGWEVFSRDGLWRKVPSLRLKQDHEEKG